MTVSAVMISLLLGTLFAILLDRKFFGLRASSNPVDHAVPADAGRLRSDLEAADVSQVPYGVLNWFLEALRDGPVEFISRHPTASIVTVLVWQWTPFMMLIMLAGLQSQPLCTRGGESGARRITVGVFRQLTLRTFASASELGTLLGSDLHHPGVRSHRRDGGGARLDRIPYFGIGVRSAAAGLFGRVRLSIVVDFWRFAVIANLSAAPAVRSAQGRGDRLMKGVKRTGSSCAIGASARSAWAARRGAAWVSLCCSSSRSFGWCLSSFKERTGRRWRPDRRVPLFPRALSRSDRIEPRHLVVHRVPGTRPSWCWSRRSS